MGKKALSAQPDTITLSRIPGAKWRDPAAAERLAAPLREKGFVELGKVDLLRIDRSQVERIDFGFDLANAFELGGLIFGQIIHERGDAGDWLEFFKFALEGGGVFDDGVAAGLSVATLACTPRASSTVCWATSPR